MKRSEPVRPRSVAAVQGAGTALDAESSPTALVLSLQRTAGNSAVTSGLAKIYRSPPNKAEHHDDPVDVVEAIVHMMSNRGVTVDTEGGEVVNRPEYSTEVKKSVLESAHVSLVREWWALAVEDVVDKQGIHSLATGTVGRIRIAQAAAESAPIVDAARADKSGKGKKWSDMYAKGLEEMTERAAREEVTEMTDAGVAAAAKPADGAADSEDARIERGTGEALAMLGELTEVSHRLSEQSTTLEHTEQAAEKAKEVAKYDEQLSEYIHKVFSEHDLAANAPELPVVGRAGSGMNFSDGVTLFKGGLDAVAAIMQVTDPEARRALMQKHSTYFGNVSQGAQVNKLLWQFVSGTIAFGGAATYGMAKLAGNAPLAEGLLDATVKGLGNVTGPLFLVGVVHGAAVLLDPAATPDEKAEAAVETASSAVGLVGFASRWVPKLAGFARWSGPIAASLTINFYMVKKLAALRHEAEAGMNRLDWTECYKEAQDAATEAQFWMRRLAVTEAILATETDARRKDELKKNGEAAADEMLERQIKPYIEARLPGSRDDSCPPAYKRRLASVQGAVAGGKGSPDAALGAGAAFLETVRKSLEDWDEIIMEKEPAKK